MPNLNLARRTITMAERDGSLFSFTVPLSFTRTRVSRRFSSQWCHSMSSDLPDWPREFFQNNGGRPSLFFVVYGEFAELPSLSASRYRSSGIPAGFELSRYDLENHAEILCQ